MKNKAPDGQSEWSLGFSHNESGAVAVLAALLFLVFFALAALVVDWGFLAVRRSEAQNAADAAALAAAAYLPDDPVGAQASAAEFVAANLPGATAVVTPAVGGNPKKAQVTVTFESPTFFAHIFGINSAQVQARATAELKTTSSRRPMEVIVVQDASGSFREEWGQAISADLSLLNLINGVSVAGDRTGFVAFSEGLKSTTYPSDPTYRTIGAPRKVNNLGDTDEAHGSVRALQMGLTDFNYANPSALTGTISSNYTIFSKDNAGGNTYTETGIDWATNEFAAHGSPDADHIIVLVSDGMPNPSSHRSLANAAAQRAGHAGIRIDTVTLTNEPTGGSYGTVGSDFQFNKDLAETYNVGADGQNLGGVALQTPDPGHLRDLLIAIGTTELSSPSLVE